MLGVNVVNQDGACVVFIPPNFAPAPPGNTQSESHILLATYLEVQVQSAEEEIQRIIQPFFPHSQTSDQKLTDRFFTQGLYEEAVSQFSVL